MKQALARVAEQVHLAVTPDQIEALSLPTAPPKKTDNRSFDGNGTVQLEAIAPDELECVVVEAVTRRMDMDALNKVREAETDIRDELITVLKGVI